MRNLPVIAVDPTESKRVYCAYVRSDPFTEPEVNRDVDVCIRRTDDASDQTIDWEDEIELEIEGDQFFPWIECDAHGRVHLLFMDSRNDPDQDDSETVHAFFDVYYAYSTDQGETWTHIRLTDEMFDVDAADDNPEDENPCDFFGDYLGMGVAGHRVYPAYGATADGRTEAMTRCIVFGENASREDIDATAGTLISGGLTEISTSDDSRAIVRDVPSGAFDPILKTETVVVFEASGVGLEPAEIDLWIEGHVTKNGVAGTLSLKNWVTSTWFTVAVYTPSNGTDSNFLRRGLAAEATGTTPDFDFIRGSDGRIELRIEHQVNSTGGQSDSLESRFDFIQAWLVPD